MTTETTKKLAAQANETKLQRAVRLWLNDQGRDYDDGWRGAYRDLMRGGCQSGIVGSLIYYRDTVKFYKRHETEIDGLLREMMQDAGHTSPRELFGDKWDDEDPLAKDDTNRNLLAWFGFEETARALASAAGYDY